jgi:hypothetical protein
MNFCLNKTSVSISQIQTLITLYITYNGNNTLLILLILFPGAIRNHILTWAVEKNRRIVDGYNFEVMSEKISFQGCFKASQLIININ